MGKIMHSKWFKGNMSIYGGSSIEPTTYGGVGAEVEMYVSEQRGNDTWDGLSYERAKATIQGAVDVANTAEYALIDVNIHIEGGYYLEDVWFSRVGTGLDYTAMLWDAGGINIGEIGTIRLIADSNVFLHGTAAATAPTISIGRPNVEVYNFATIKAQNGSAKPWTAPDGDAVNHFGMPAVYVGDAFNNTTILHGAGNNCKFVNCRINGGGSADGGCILNLGSKWIHIIDCVIEYGDDYGIGIGGSNKGNPAENIIRGCTFHQCTDADILHANAVVLHISDCYFASATVTEHFVRLVAGGGASILVTLTNCSTVQTALAGFISGNNSGCIASGMHTAGAAGAGEFGDADLTA